MNDGMILYVILLELRQDVCQVAAVARTLSESKRERPAVQRDAA